MKKKHFSVEQIVGILKQAQVGVPVAEVIRKAGIKLIKRSMYGRASFDLLRLRVLHVA